jgi:hypothetical protein
MSPIKLKKEDRPKRASRFGSLLDVCLSLLELIFYPIYWIIRIIVYVVYYFFYGIFQCLRFIGHLLAEIIEAIFSGW